MPARLTIFVRHSVGTPEKAGTEMPLFCIYCRRDSSTSKRKAHIAPQALIKTSTVLPLGAECDDCNERAGKLEKAFIHHNRIGPVLLVSGAPGKRGRPRKQIGHMVHLEKGGFSVKQTGIDSITFGPGSVHVQIKSPSEFDDGKFRRGLYHMAFNYLAWKKGVPFVLDQRFDGVRKYVRFAGYGEAWPYAQVMFPDEKPNPRMSLTLLEDVPGCVVRFVSVLDEFYVDLEGATTLHTWAKTALPPETGLF